MTATPPATGIREPVLRWTLGANYLLCSFGRFSLVPVLAIMLARQTGGAGWVTSGLGLFGFIVFAGLSALLVSRWLPTFSYMTSMSAGTLCSALGFGLLAYTHDPVLTLVLLFLAGFGISVNAVLARVLVAESVASETGRNNIFSMQQIATNAAAALGPFLAGALYVSGNAAPLLAFVSVAYLLAGVALFIGLPRRLRPPRGPRTRGGGLAAGLRLLRDPECRRASVVTAFGAFVYGQFYSAFALLVALAIDSALLRGVLLGGPPVAIVILQAGVTAVVNRSLRAGVPPLTLLVRAVLVFGSALFLLGTGLPIVVGSVLAMTIWAFAEMLFTPVVSIAFTRITSVSRLAASNLQGVAWTTGEALGSLCGGAVFLLCHRHGAGSAYWLVLATATILGMLPYLRPRRVPSPVAPDTQAPAGPAR
ncbi:MFS transporter [Streptomyces lavendulocolor]|uniref:MFS transporter n=1 Tax=Streptomyces lavendulocolor TaxID=67316 RepID=UPI00340A9EE2